MTDKLYLTHDDMKQQMSGMFRQMHLDGYMPDLVVGVTRGGLVPAVYVSHYLEKPMTTLAVSFRDADVMGSCVEIVRAIADGKRVLIVDDICDSGATLEWIYEQVRSFNQKYVEYMKTMTLVHNWGCRTFTPDYFGLEVNKLEKDVWLVFPWEQ